MTPNNSGFVIGPLQKDQIDRTYVIAQAAMPDLTLDSWRRVTGGSERRNFIVATDTRGYSRGLCHVRFEKHPVAGPLFDVAMFIVISPLHEHEIAAALFACIERQAIDAKSKYLRFWSLRPEIWSVLDDQEFRHRWDHGVIYRL
ncbi:hypothetical protein ACK9YZ_32970 [Rhizobium sp. ZK1]|uniref:hypothetical protein n=1 Tax=Rhizobium sp. ZK1 TaxID=3389872 RepID=UPI0039F651F3